MPLNYRLHYVKGLLFTEPEHSPDLHVYTVHTQGPGQSLPLFSQASQREIGRKLSPEVGGLRERAMGRRPECSYGGLDLALG